MQEELFLIDSNALITPYHNYYPFDFAPGFWSHLEVPFKSGRIQLLDMVKDEVCHGNDDDKLKIWINNLSVVTISHEDIEIIQFYRKVLDYVGSADVYTKSALDEWSKKSVADPWLIAASAAKGFTLISLEERSKGLSSKTPKNPCLQGADI